MVLIPGFSLPCTYFSSSIFSSNFSSSLLGAIVGLGVTGGLALPLYFFYLGLDFVGMIFS
jgi:hypothetical protein